MPNGKHITGKTTFSAEDRVIVNGNTSLDLSTKVVNTEITLYCSADGVLTISNSILANPRLGDTTSTITMKQGESFILAYSGASSNLQITSAGTRFQHQGWADLTDGNDANSGKSPTDAKKTLAAILTNVIANYTANLGYGAYSDVITLSSANNLTIIGTGIAGKVQTTLAGGNSITGTSTRVGLKYLNIASSSAATALTFSDSGGLHVLEQVGSNNNTAAVFIQFGTNAYSASAAAPKLVARLIGCDFSTVSGQINLPDLSAGQYALLQILDTVHAGALSIGAGWIVQYNNDALFGSVVYTGGATSAQFVNLSRQSAGDVIAVVDLTADKTFSSTELAAGKVLAITNKSTGGITVTVPFPTSTQLRGWDSTTVFKLSRGASTTVKSDGANCFVVGTNQNPLKYFTNFQSASFTALPNHVYRVNANSAAITVTLPTNANSSAGDMIVIYDIGNAGAYSINIVDSSSNPVSKIAITGGMAVLFFTGSVWRTLLNGLYSTDGKFSINPVAPTDTPQFGQVVDWNFIKNNVDKFITTTYTATQTISASNTLNIFTVSTAATATLPTASSHTGRMIVVANAAGSTANVSCNSQPIIPGASFVFASDGVSWLAISSYGTSVNSAPAVCYAALSQHVNISSTFNYVFDSTNLSVDAPFTMSGNAIRFPSAGLYEVTISFLMNITNTASYKDVYALVQASGGSKLESKWGGAWATGWTINAMSIPIPGTQATGSAYYSIEKTFIVRVPDGTLDSDGDKYLIIGAKTSGGNAYLEANRSAINIVKIK